MPQLEKQTISNFLRSECLRRLRLDLSPDTSRFQPERTALQMPPRIVRPGLPALAQAGEEWEHEKLNDLASTFGQPSIIGNVSTLPSGQLDFANTDLLQSLLIAPAGVFIVQAQYDVGPSFLNAFQASSLGSTYGLVYRELRPDIVQVCAAGRFTQEILPNGEVVDVPATSTRLPLRVIDIKLTAELSIPYFIESAYYNVTLAGWLVDHQLIDRFFVACSTTVWPGSHDASAIVRLTTEHQRVGSSPTRTELDAALEEDLESGDFRIFAPRLRRFFSDELPRALSTPWTDLPWHVDNRCIGCEYLGFPWPGSQTDVNHCWSHAMQQDHLSRVAFVSRGARGALEECQITNVADLAATHPSAPALESHHSLRATRTVVAGRAGSLTSGAATIPLQSGTSAVMPAWADLRVYLTADFDIGSGITIAFGISSVWAVSPQRVPGGQHFSRTQSQVFPVDQRSLQVELRELTNLLNAIDVALRNATALLPAATVQIYVWDTLTYEHFVRVIGRHLASFMQNRQLRRLAWLFPPETIVANAELSDRSNPITVVREVVRAVVAAPVPHYYSLLNVARSYHSTHTASPFNQFIVAPLFEDPLSDQVPSERAHEIWSRSAGARPWNTQLQQLDRTVRTRLSALESVTQRLGEDLQGQLDQTAPRIADLSPPRLPQRMADDSRLWYVFSKLDVALKKLENQKIHAMPPHEREARFKSALLTRRLAGTEELAVLVSAGFTARTNLWAFEIAASSTEFRAKEGDFTFALCPLASPGFLSRQLRSVAGSLILPLATNQSDFSKMEWVMQVTIAYLDRDSRRIILDVNRSWFPVIQALEQNGLVNLSQDVMLDPTYQDFLLKRLEATLNAIGNPPIATANAIPAVIAATGQTRRPTQGLPSVVGEVLWDAATLYASSVSRNLPSVQQLLQQNGLNLDASQWAAWHQALSHRLRLIWGPPGTGKSRTLKAIVVGALIEASRAGRTLRVLITGPTYEAIDNVLLPLEEILTGTTALALPNVTIARLRSSTRPTDQRVPAAIDIATGGPSYDTLVTQLAIGSGLVLIGTTAQQSHRLMIEAGGPAAPLFDMILIDEASQVDVATACLPLAGLAANGCVVVAGDPKQLPPIHQAVPPLDLDYMVGPVFSYFEQRFALTPEILQVNYRSCQEVVALAHMAGYPQALHAHSPDLRLNHVTSVPSNSQPPAWPASVHWCSEWTELLDPSRPAVCFVYPEGRSSQWNEFEAQTVSVLCHLLEPRLGCELVNRIDENGTLLGHANMPYSPTDFWTRGIGIVTPHRAQQALVVSRLQAIFPVAQHAAIRAAVDTVERFQGQERDVIIASFALGDPDAINDEDEFLLSLNRFNVMASRARAKLIVLVSQEVVDHLSSDVEVLNESVLLKSFVDQYCSSTHRITLGYVRNGTPKEVNGTLRWYVR